MSRTVRLFGVARGVRGGSTLYDKSQSQYNAKMKYLSESIFGEYKVSMDSKPNKKLMYSMKDRPLYERPEIVHYYPAHEQTNWLMDALRDYGLFRNEHKDFLDEMERLRNIRGKSRYGKYSARNKKKRSEEGKQ